MFNKVYKEESGIFRVDMVEFCLFTKKNLSEVFGRTKLHKEGI